ncbi:MAG: FAD-binding domain-containing protein [Planctomycetaceae bacterium]
MQVVWLKRDLRLHNHRPLVAAAKSGEPVVCLYVYEPELWNQPDADARHLQFINQSLTELRDALQSIGGTLLLRYMPIRDALTELHQTQPISRLLAHEETGTLWTFERDKSVARWCRENAVVFKEYPQNGVVRPLKSRDGWAQLWHVRMNEPIHSAPTQLRTVSHFETGCLTTADELGLSPVPSPDRIQRGGEAKAQDLLKSFLRERGQQYHRKMSSPLTAWDSCSRLSTHLAWGTISVSQVYDAVQRRILDIRRSRMTDSAKRKNWLDALKAYGERLHWHCHFMQKLEDQPDLENVNMLRACDGLRPDVPDTEKFNAWKDGTTGYPLVDACMRSVRETGWLTFRMRAMVVSFASYHLWLDWRPTSQHLARMFTDYEPGIHYNQFQMQSGTTGISSLRIYNPIKQVHDQDSDGTYIREWVPELKNVPSEHIAEPHRMTLEQQERAGCIIGTDYPSPIVEHTKAYAAAQTRMKRIRRETESRREAKSVFRKHGSRRRGRR